MIMEPRKVMLLVLGAWLLAAGRLFACGPGDFADIPCQDGTWDEARQTCVPDPALFE